MKILYIVTRGVTAGGVMSIVSKKINYLALKGYNITLLSMTKCDVAFYPLSENIKLISANNNDGVNTTLKDLWYAIKHIKDNNYDLIVSADAQYITWTLPFITRKRVFLELHQSFDGLINYYSGSLLSGLKNCLFYAIRKIVYPRFDKIIVLTDEDKEKWGFKNIIVIPNFHTLPCQKSLNIKNKDVVVVSRFHKQKGYDLLIDAWKIVSKTHPNSNLLFYGAELTENVIDILKSHNTPDSFKVVGFEKDINKIYRNAYINIVPSRSESFSLTTVEAMCFGVPTIAFDIAGPRSIIKRNKTGVLVNCYNVEELASSITKILDDETLRESMSNQCLQSAKNYYIENIMKEWIHLFNN